MCGRIGFGTATWREVLEILRATAVPGSEALYRARYNLAPTQQHWIVRQVGEQRQLEPAVWGLPDSKGLLINARSETAHRLPTFRQAFAEGRCLVPADGFYEWQGMKGQRVPLWFYPREGLLLMAGLYRQEDDRPHFVILTTAANESMRLVHDRMPALLSVEDAATEKRSGRIWSWSHPDVNSVKSWCTTLTTAVSASSFLMRPWSASQITASGKGWCRAPLIRTARAWIRLLEGSLGGRVPALPSALTG